MIPFESYREMRLADIKGTARTLIEGICPAWKQQNLTARGVELALKGQSNWTPQEHAEHLAGQVLWDQIKEIRRLSNVAEVLLQAATTEQEADEALFSMLRALGR